MKPLSDFVILQYEGKKKTKGGVVLSDVSSNKPAKAKVLEVGPGRLDRHGNLIKTIIKKGDVVVINPYLPIEIEVDDKKYLVMREGEIFAKL